jgi:hypothetical protein
VTLVLVSPDLLASKFVMSEELRALLARGIPLAVVHVRASMVETVGSLAALQWAHDRARTRRRFWVTSASTRQLTLSGFTAAAPEPAALRRARYRRHATRLHVNWTRVRGARS